MRLFVNASGSSTIPGSITNSATSIVVSSSSGFPVPAAFQQFSAVILTPGFDPNNPLATPFEYVWVTGNNTGTNTLTVARGKEGTSGHAFAAGATIAAVALAGDIDASFPRQITQVVAPGGTASVTLPASGSLPTNFSTLLIKWFGQTSNASACVMNMRFNGDAAADYFSSQADLAAPNVLSFQEFGFPGGTNQGIVGSLAPSASLNLGAGDITIGGYNQTAFRVTWIHQCWRTDGGASGNDHAQVGGGVWGIGTLAVVTSITLLCGTGNFTAGSTFTLYAEP